MISSQFILFLVAGGIAAGANFGSRFFFSIFFSYSVAVIFAYLAGMLVAFLLMRKNVFNASKGPLQLHVTKFAVVNLFAILQTLVISLLLARWALPSVGIEEQAEAIGHLVGVLVPVVTSYIGHKSFTFK
jgi:putative flippase GtrA